jgi:hypothetical protein
MVMIFYKNSFSPQEEKSNLKSTNMHFRITAIIAFAFAFSQTATSQNCTVNAGVPIQWCPGEQMKLFGNVTGLYNGATITWSQISGPTVTIENANSLTTNCGTAVAAATYVFRIRAICQDANVVSNDVTYTVVAATPTPPAANAGSTINLNCLEWGGTIPLNATPAASGFIGTWSIVSGGQGSFSNVNSPTAIFTPIQSSPANPGWACPAISNSYVLRWTLTSTAAPAGNCPSAQISTSATVTINVAMWNAVSARAVPPGCGNTTNNVQLYGTCKGTGTSQWTLISGPPGYAFTPNAAQNITLSNPPSGSYTFRYTVTVGTPACVAGFKDISFNVSGANVAITTSNANAGNVKTGICAGEPFSSSIQLSANLPNVGEIGTWSQIGGGTIVAFSNVNSNNSIVSGMNSAVAPYTFRWTISNAAGCSSFSDVVFRNLDAFIPTSINIVSGCNSDLITGITSYCNSATKLVMSITATNIPSAQGWYMDGFYLNAKPDGSPIAFGYKSRVVSFFNVGGVSGNHITEVADNTCPNAGLDIQMFRNAGGQTLSTWPTISVPAAYFTGVYAGTIVLKNTFCSLSFAVPFTINVTRAVSAANAGTDQSLACGATQTNLAGNDPLLTAPFYGMGTWQQISGPSTALIADKYDKSSLITSLIPGTYSFAWTINAGSACTPNIDTVNIRVSAGAPQAVFAGNNQTLCYNAAITLTASLAAPGSLATMLTTTGSTGIWSQTSGPAGVVINSPNNVSTTITGLISSSVYVFRYAASNLCGSQTSDVTITTTGVQGPSQADAGVNQCLGAGGTITLNAAIPTIGTGIWTKLNVANPGTITTPNANSTTVTGVTPNAVYGYVWTVSGDLSCASSKDTVYISNVGPLSAAVARPNLDTCATEPGNTFVLYATPPTIGNGKWVQTSGPAVASFNPNLATTTVTISTNGNYRFNWVVGNSVCPNNIDEVIVNFYSRASAAVVTTSNTSLCGSTNGVINLNAAPITSGSGLWSIISGGGVITSPTSASTVATLNAGINTLRWTVSSLNAAVCPSTYDDVTVSFSPTALARDTALCRANNALITGSTKGAATSGAWTLITQPIGSPAVTITAQGAQDSVASVGPLVPGVYTFRWTVVHPTCGTTFDDMLLTIDDVANPNAGADVCDTVGSPILLSGNAIPAGASATWTRFSAPSGASAGAFSTPTNANTTYNITPVASYLAGTYNFQYQFTKGACQIKDYVQIRAITDANAGADIKQCNNGTFTLNGSALATGETGTWTKLNTGDPGIITNTNLRNTTVTGLNPGDSVNLIWKATTIEGCEKADTVALVNRVNTVAAGTAAPTYCDNLTGLDLLGNVASPGTGSWSLVSAPTGAPAINWTNQFTQNANVKNLTNGTYVFRYTINNLPCTPSTNDVTITSTCGALPVRFINVSGVKQEKSILVSWQVGTEVDVQHYEVERSADGINFTRIGNVTAVNAANYSFEDVRPLEGNNFYRIKSVDNSGLEKHSSTIKISFSTKTFIQLAPNPATDYVTISGLTGAGFLTMYSVDGKMLDNIIVKGNRVNYNLKSLVAGTYILQYVSNDKSQTIKLVKK